MMSLSSSQAGIVGARRKKLNQTQFSSYRYTKVEYNSPVSFVETPPSAKFSFTARHIYNYNKNNNTFTFLGVQKAQSLIRKKKWISNITFTGSNPSVLNGTYIRSNFNSTVYWKNGIPNSDPNISLEDTNIWFFSSSQAPEGTAAVLYINNRSFKINTLNVDTLNYPLNYPNLSYEVATTLDNTTLKNINNNRLYSTKDADLNQDQLIPDVNFNINTSNIFDTKNLAHNEKVFVDIRWVKFIHQGRRGYRHGPQEAFYMNNKKGNIYRAGIIIKDNTIDSMLYHTDLATDETLISQMQRGTNLNL